MLQLSGFRHVALTVSDLDVSIEWYTKVLGFEEAFREDSDERKGCVMRYPAGSFWIGLVRHNPVDAADRFDPRRRGLDHVAFAVESREALDICAEQLTASGVPNSGAIDAGPGAILNFKDPDGIALALFWDRV